MLEEKVAKAIEVVQGLPGKNPVVMSSFGKDSMVLLDIVKRSGFKFPLLFMKEPFFPEKYAFANEQILRNRYVVYDYPPLSTAVTKKGPVFEVSNFYQVGTEAEYIFLPTGIIPPGEGDYLCGLYDLLNKPTGTFRFPWDTVLLGHKSSDKDPMLGDVELTAHVVDAGPVQVAFPIRDFTDEDIWAYHNAYGLPVHSSRYANGAELPDKTFNPDYFPACMACIDRDGPSSVYCPRVGYTIPNISNAVKYVTVQKPSYVR